LKHPETARALSGNPAVASLLGLLRAGEQSAALAFGRLLRRLPAAAAERTGAVLGAIRADEACHDALLARAATVCAVSPQVPPALARRFFLQLESRELATQLARIAALDGCVCQVLARVLAAGDGSTLPIALASALERIRRDEGRHVRAARVLAREHGLDESMFHVLDLETRRSFDRVLAWYEPAFVVLGVDAQALRRDIRRDRN
jgi:hypothetical protein